MCINSINDNNNDNNNNNNNNYYNNSSCAFRKPQCAYILNNNPLPKFTHQLTHSFKKFGKVYL